MAIAFDRKNVKRILLIRFSCMGDVLLTTPAVATMRYHFPRAHITYLTEKAPSEALKHNPNIDRVLIFKKGIVQKMAMEKPYDLVMNFDWFYSSQALCFLSQAKYRIGYPVKKKTGHKLEACNVYNIEPACPPKGWDIIDKFLNNIRFLGLKDYTRDTAFYLTRQEKIFAGSFIEKHKLNKKFIVGMHPGASRRKELWQAGKFAVLADMLISRLSAYVLIFQGPGEKDIVMDTYKQIKQKDKVLIAPELPLRKYASLVNKCNMFIAHDRGPMHISASLGVSTIGIFTTPYARIWFPYKEKKDCAYIEKKTAKMITAEEVFRKIKKCKKV
ncbi:MAG: glycosyltransferase family 9 protein [Candidatus Omnitrophota bacterium]|nr:glycosyltransferase family 9 protein [Candidatus Omnitrophota bacterium]